LTALRHSGIRFECCGFSAVVAGIAAAASGARDRKSDPEMSRRSPLSPGTFPLLSLFRESIDKRLNRPTQSLLVRDDRQERGVPGGRSPPDLPRHAPFWLRRYSRSTRG